MERYPALYSSDDRLAHGRDDKHASRWAPSGKQAALHGATAIISIPLTGLADARLGSWPVAAARAISATHLGPRGQRSLVRW
jgi:hypothetical protein